MERERAAPAVEGRHGGSPGERGRGQLPGDLRSPHARGNCAAHKDPLRRRATGKPVTAIPATRDGAHRPVIAHRLLRFAPAASALFSQAEPDRAGRGAAFGSGALQGCGALLANRRNQDFPVVTGDGIARGLDVTKPTWRPRRSGWSRRSAGPAGPGGPASPLAPGAPARQAPRARLARRGTLLSRFALRAGGPGRSAGAWPPVGPGRPATPCGPAGPAGPCEPSKHPVNRTEADSATTTVSPRMRMLRNVGEGGWTQRQSFERQRRIDSGDSAMEGAHERTDSEVRKLSRHPLTRTSESKGHLNL
jgi:hypothetical protein